MWHDFKILLRELMTTIYGSTKQDNSVEHDKHPATDNVDTLVEATQQLILIQLPGNRSTDQVTKQGEQNKRQSERTPITTILQRLSIPVAPVIKRRDNQQHKLQHTDQCGCWQDFTRKVILYMTKTSSACARNQKHT